jgi:hypothetical protein
MMEEKNPAKDAGLALYAQGMQGVAVCILDAYGRAHYWFEAQSRGQSAGLAGCLFVAATVAVLESVFDRDGQGGRI